MGFGLVAVSLVRALRMARGEPSLVGLGEDGSSLQLATDEEPVVMLPATVVSSAVVWLVWREARGGRGGVLLLLQDQMAPAAWRELQVWLRLRVAGAMTASGDP